MIRSRQLGEIKWLSGRILSASGEPLRNATIEIWQCDNHGAYLHSGTVNANKKDKNFQGYGRFVTGSTGECVFRTSKPVPYPGRTPHIHVKVKRGGNELLTTQCYIKDHPGNAGDSLWRSIRNEQQRESVTVPFEPLSNSKIGELRAHFDVVLGLTPEG